jgi:hypothetical protein
MNGCQDIPWSSYSHNVRPERPDGIGMVRTALQQVNCVSYYGASGTDRV